MFKIYTKENSYNRDISPEERAEKILLEFPKICVYFMQGKMFFHGKLDILSHLLNKAILI